MNRVILMFAIGFLGPAWLHAADGIPQRSGDTHPTKQIGRQEADESAIRKAVASYVATFNRGDAKSLAAMWSTEAVYTNPVSGEQVVGRNAIEKQFAAIFDASKGVKLEARTDAVRFAGSVRAGRKCVRVGR